MMNRIKIRSIFCFGAIFVLLSLLSFAHASSGHSNSMVDRTSHLVFQLSIIVFAAWAGGAVFERMKLPSVLGEIIAGVVIGPYCLGQIPFHGFPHGVFPLADGDFPITVELYSLATIASIILLFFVGLETDIATFLRYSFQGSIVGIFGVFVCFVLGDIFGIILSKHIMGFHSKFFHPIPLFLGVISTATSVGITARILSEKRKINSPEGVTILAAAVIDDVIGIIVLAIVLGMVKSGHVGWREVMAISIKAVSIWLGFTLLGLKYAQRISAVLKRINDRPTIAVISFGIALLLAGIFEKSGLAMIIGAYVVGLSLSKTDLSYIVQDKLEMLQRFFVPIFFCVMGMLINIRDMASIQTLWLGAVFVILAILGKLIGCGLPALFLNFNFRGALRVGVGMIPRGEVALIIASIGLSSGVLDDWTFSIVMIMTFVTTLITPPILAKMFEFDGRTLRKDTIVSQETKSIVFDMPSPETAELLLIKVVSAFENEGFYVHRMGSRGVFHIRKDDVFIVLKSGPKRLIFDCMEKDTTFIHTLFYEVIAELEQVMQNLQSFADKQAIGRKIFDVDNGNSSLKGRHKFSLPSPKAAKVGLKGSSKEEVLEELVELLVFSGQLADYKKDKVLKDLIEREHIMSTGMQDGIALPHAKTVAVDKIVGVVATHKQGVDFGSFDNKPAHIFVMILAPKNIPNAYLQTMSTVSSFLAQEENRNKILECKTEEELYELMKF